MVKFQAFLESQELPPGTPGFSWNTTPGFRRKPRISLLLRPFPGFLEVKKHGKAKKARSSRLFLALRAFPGFFLQGLLTTTCADEYTFNLL